MQIYILHFTDAHYHAKHYIGTTRHLLQRLRRHAQGRAAKLTAYLADNGLTWTLAAVYQVTDAKAERRIKRQNNGPRYCPLCNPGIRKQRPFITRIDLRLLPFQERNSQQFLEKK